MGDAIVSADLPSDPRKILGALIYYVETGSLEPPAPPPSREESAAITEADAEIARLRDQLAQAQAQNQGAPETATPSPVFPGSTEPEPPAATG